MRKNNKSYCLLVIFIMPIYIYGNERNILDFKKYFTESMNDPKYSYGNPSYPTYDEKDNMYIYEASNGLVYKYNSECKYICRFGQGLGQGPGEVPSFGCSFFLVRNSIYIYDYRGKLHSYTTEGKFRWTKELKFRDSYFLTISGIFDDGVGYATKCPSNNFKLRQMIRFSNYGINMIEIDHIDYSKYASEVEMPALSYLPLFVSTNDNKNGIYFAVNQEYTIFYNNWKGSNIVIKENVSPLLASKEFKQKAYNEMKNKYPAGKFSFHVLDTFPVIRGMYIDRDNNIWVLSYTNERNGFVKYNSSGKYLKYYQYRNFKIYNSYKNVVFYIRGQYIYVSQYDNETGLIIYRAKIRE